MPLLDEIRATKLIELAHARFDPNLSDAELEVLRDSASFADIPDPDENTPRPEVRAEFLRWLASDSEPALQIDPKGIRVSSARIANDLDLEGCRVDVFLTFQWCIFEGKLKLESAKTKGIFLLNCSLMEGVSAGRIKIDGPLSLDASTISGEVDLIGAQIDGQLSFSNSEFSVARSIDGLDQTHEAPIETTGGTGMPDEILAISADSAEIGGDVYFDSGFVSDGSIRLIGAHIRGDLYCETAQLLSRKGEAFIGDRTRVDGGLFFGSDSGVPDSGTRFKARGAVSLIGMEILGDVNFTGADVTEVHCRNMRLAGDLIWRRIHNPRRSTLDLTDAKLKRLQDDQASWPPTGNLTLDGLTYQELSLDEIELRERAPLHDANQRIQWLMRQQYRRGIRPQPWVQLSRYFETMGDRRGVKHVQFRQKCLQAESKGPIARRAVIAFAWLEEAPGRILYSITLTLLLGTLVFAGAYRAGAMIKNDAKVSTDRYPPFQPFVYTLENAVPLVKLGMDDKWVPDPQHVARPWFPERDDLKWLGYFNSYWFLAISRWLLILSGWFQATVLAAALSGRFKP